MSLYDVSPYCEANTHNTLNRARYGKPKCICPTALELLAKWKTEHRDRDRHDNPERVKERNQMKLKVASVLPPMRSMPDLRRGTCTTERGRKVAEKGFNTELSRKGFKLRAEAKRMCGYCLVRAECLVWVQQEEDPPGSWGGVYGGLDPWERMGTPLVINPETRKVGYANVIERATGQATT